MSKKAWIIFAAVCVILFGGLIVASNKNKLDVSAIDTSKIQLATEASGSLGDNVLGNKDSKVVIIEYGDYQCPGCGSAYANMKKITQKYEDEMAFVFRNFPITAIHPNALITAATAEAAGKQGKFWQMHDLLFKDQAGWRDAAANVRTDLMASYAKEIGLNGDTFLEDIRSEPITKKINFDQALAKKDKVTGTPMFTLNGKELNQYVKDGEIVPAGTPGAGPIWGDVDAFEKLILLPAFKEAGVTPPQQ